MSGRYSDNFSDPNWWPTPPPKPLQAPSALKILLVVLFAALVGGGIYASMRLSGSSSPTTTTVSDRQAMAQCLKSVGGGSGFQFRGRLGGGGPSRSTREAFAVCRSLLQPDRRLPIAPQRTATVAPPAA